MFYHFGYTNSSLPLKLIVANIPALIHNNDDSKTDYWICKTYFESLRNDGHVKIDFGIIGVKLCVQFFKIEKLENDFRIGIGSQTKTHTLSKTIFK